VTWERPATAVEVLYIDGCPNLEALMASLRAIIGAADGAVRVTLREVRSDEEARALRFVGSPTVRVDGRDVEPGIDACTSYGLGCRVYRAANGVSGTPSVALVLGALNCDESAARRE